MAIITGISDKGIFTYSSIKGSEGISEEEQEKAVNLNNLIKKEMSKLRKNNSRNLSKEKVELYWDFGFSLRKIFDADLVLPGEKKMFWKNVRLHAPEMLLAKDRGPNRMHINYCFRLSGYPKNLALKRKWSEWVYLFDSPSINGENRFDKWDQGKIKKEKKYISRENTRLFIQCLNSILGNKETNDLEMDELSRCYEGAWQLTKNLIKNKKYSSGNDFKVKLKEAIHKKNYLAGKLIDNEISPENFAKEIIGSI